MHTSDPVSLLLSVPWFGWVAILGIVFGSLTGMLKMRYEHIERMEMIRQGLNPDQVKPPAPPEV
jgi:hypothetical protein